MVCIWLMCSNRDYIYTHHGTVLCPTKQSTANRGSEDTAYEAVMASDPWVGRNKWGEPYNCPGLLRWETSPGCGTGSKNWDVEFGTSFWLRRCCCSGTESQIRKAREQSIFKSLNYIPEQSSGRFVGVGNTSIHKLKFVVYVIQLKTLIYAQDPKNMTHNENNHRNTELTQMIELAEDVKSVCCNYIPYVQKVRNM